MNPVNLEVYILRLSEMKSIFSAELFAWLDVLVDYFTIGAVSCVNRDFISAENAVYRRIDVGVDLSIYIQSKLSVQIAIDVMPVSNLPTKLIYSDISATMLNETVLRTFWISNC